VSRDPKLVSRLDMHEQNTPGPKQQNQEVSVISQLQLITLSF